MKFEKIKEFFSKKAVKTVAVFMAVLLISHFMPEGFWDRVGRLFVRTPWLVKLAIFVVVVQLVLQFRSEDVPPFIYFQF